MVLLVTASFVPPLEAVPLLGLLLESLAEGPTRFLVCFDTAASAVFCPSHARILYKKSPSTTLCRNVGSCLVSAPYHY